MDLAFFHLYIEYTIFDPTISMINLPACKVMGAHSKLLWRNNELLLELKKAVNDNFMKSKCELRCLTDEIYFNVSKDLEKFFPNKNHYNSLKEFVKNFLKKRIVDLDVDCNNNDNPSNKYLYLNA
jgi:hypothetical protein